MHRGGALLGCPIVPLIDPGNAAAAAADMVQNRFRHFEPHAKALQAGGDGSAQIVHAPWNERRGACAGRRGGFGAGIHYRLVEGALGLRPPGKGRAHRAGKHKAPCAPIVRRAWLLRIFGSKALRRSRAGALRGTMCAAPFFVRSPGIVQVAKSSEISSQAMPATSPRRWPVRIRKRMIVP